MGHAVSTKAAQNMQRLWTQGAVVTATSPLRVDFCGMTDYIPAESWCVNATVGGLKARLRMEAGQDERIHIDAGSYGIATFTLNDIGKSNNMFMRALDEHDYAQRFDFGLTVKVNCEFGAIGLSSSSSVASLYNAALALVCGEPYDPLQIAMQTQAIEPHWYGRQDQLAVSYGGFNLWHMKPGLVREDGTAISFGKVDRFPITMAVGAKETLSEDSLLIYDSGIAEGASRVLDNVVENYEDDSGLRRTFDRLNDLAQDLYKVLSQPKGGADWLYELGEAFDQIREAHEELHPSVTNERMQDLFNAAKCAGALGGRYSGAGGRGALTFICLPGETAKVTAALDKVNTPHFSPDGTAYTKGQQIHFGGFSDGHATAWYAA